MRLVYQKKADNNRYRRIVWEKLARILKTPLSLFICAWSTFCGEKMPILALFVHLQVSFECGLMLELFSAAYHVWTSTNYFLPSSVRIAVKYWNIHYLFKIFTDFCKQGRIVTLWFDLAVSKRFIRKENEQTNEKGYKHISLSCI